MCRLQGHYVNFGEGLLIEDVKCLTVLEGVNPSVGINVVVLREELCERPNLIGTDSKNDVHILRSTPGTIVRTRHGAAYVIRNAKAI
jgi:hypothetical protein